MKILKKVRLYWLLQLLGWGTFIVLNLLYNYFDEGGVLYKMDYFYSILIGLIGISFSHFIRILIIRQNWFSDDFVGFFKKLFIVSLALGPIHMGLLYSFSFVCDQITIINLTALTFSAFALTFSVIYFTWGLIYFAFYFFRNFKKEEIKNLKHQVQVNEMMFNKLKSQLNPHFVFNSLNVIRALIDEDSAKAKKGVTMLSNILRHTLTIDDKKLITFKEEILLIKDYLELQKMRFEERLNIDIQTDEESLNFLVPPMLVQTLVENGIKHGISKLVKGGTISLQANADKDVLILLITNPGKYDYNNSSESGFGLKNSIERLYYLYGNDARIDIQNDLKTEEGKVTVKVIIPKK